MWPKFGKIAPFELKISDGARNGPSRLHVNFEPIHVHLNFSVSEKPLLGALFTKSESEVPRPSCEVLGSKNFKSWSFAENSVSGLIFPE